VTPTAKKLVTRESRFTGPVKGCLFFVTFFGANKESKARVFTIIKLLPEPLNAILGLNPEIHGLNIIILNKGALK
jgi:hypothetical protein